MATSDVREQLQTALGAQYTLERELGRGGMATVYLAQDTKHHRAVALKVLHGPPPSGADLALLANQLLTAGDTSGARDALRQALARASTEYVREDHVARAFMRLGDHERAIQWLVKGAAANVALISFLPVNSLWNPIRSDPRIQAIMQQLKVR